MDRGRPHAPTGIYSEALGLSEGGLRPPAGDIAAPQTYSEVFGPGEIVGAVFDRLAGDRRSPPRLIVKYLGLEEIVGAVFDGPAATAGRYDL